MTGIEIRVVIVGVVVGYSVIFCCCLVGDDNGGVAGVG